MNIQVSSSTIPHPEDLGLTANSTGGDADLARLLNQCQGVDLQVINPEMVVWLQELRDRAALWVNKLTIPSKRDEEWRFTDLSPLLKVNFSQPTRFDLAESALAELTLPSAPIRLVFINGVYAPALSTVTELPAGLVVTNLAELPVRYHSQVSEYLAREQGAMTEVFTALNTAGLTDVAIVWLAKNTVVEKPIHLLFISRTSEMPTVSQPRCLVVAEIGSQLSLIEEYRGVGEGTYLTNAVTEIVLEENAQVSHTRIERESKEAFHIGKNAIAQSGNSRYTCNSINVGSKLSRHNLEVLQTGEQTETTLNGLTMIAGKQLSDTHSVMAYTKPYGTSKQLHKCIVSDQAHAVFNGKIFVPQAAQLTNASQLNRNLLLSPQARVDTKPQLEITADNVKCSHGATVGQLEADEVFYLQSRGLTEIAARNLLIDAFAAEILNQLPGDTLKKQLSQLVRQISK